MADIPTFESALEVHHREFMEDCRSIREMVQKSIQESIRARLQSQQNLEKIRQCVVLARMAADEACEPFTL